jgi:uncharacterized membrane protein
MFTQVLYLFPDTKKIELYIAMGYCHSVLVAWSTVANFKLSNAAIHMYTTVTVHDIQQVKLTQLDHTYTKVLVAQRELGRAEAEP